MTAESNSRGVEPSLADGSGGPPFERQPRLRVPTELSLWLLSVVTFYGYSRLFVDRKFLLPVLAAATLSHLTAALLRRVRVPIGLAAAASLLLMGFVVTWLCYRSTTQYGLPSSLTWDGFVAELAEGLDRFRHDRAPVEPLTSYVAVSALAFWVVAFLADWSAFRLWSCFEATIPAATIFLFAALLGADQGHLHTTVLFFFAALGFWLMHRTSRAEMSTSWVRGHERAGVGRQLRIGAGLAFTAMVSTAALSPFLPGAGSVGMLDVRDLGGGGTRTTRSPLVDIRQRLVDQREVVMFTVDSPEHAYWRLTALDRFDGRSWRSSKPFQRVSGDLLTVEPRPGNFRSVDQEFEIASLAQIWLPAAYAAQLVTGASRELSWNADTSTLIVGRDTSDGLSYTVNSAISNLSAAQLRASRGTVPTDITQHYLQLPRTIPDRVHSLASEITKAQPTAYDAAMALQEYFRRNFTYSTDVAGGEDIDAIEDFLFSAARAGYCEQFAGTYAAMARSVGLPARVAVGFTPGDAVPGQPHSFVVRGRHAHAWPEVYIAGAGWVLFEPTPGRGAPNAAYTNTDEQQDSVVATANPQSSTTVAENPPSDPAASPSPLNSASPTTVAAERSGGAGRDTAGPIGGWFGLLLCLAGLLLIALFAPLAWRRLQRWRRRRRCRSSADRLEQAWLEVSESLQWLGVRAELGETPAEFAARAQDRFGESLALGELAEILTVARYAPDGVDHAQAETAWRLSLALVAQAASTAGTGRRLGAAYRRRGRSNRPT